MCARKVRHTGRAGRRLIFLLMKAHTPKKESTYCKPSATSTPWNSGKGKAPAKKRTYTKSNKLSKAGMDHRP